MSDHLWLKELDRTIPVPLYYQLKQLIMTEIQNNHLKVGDTLPTEAELCDMLDISRPTIRQALSELVNEGYLQRKKGKGTFVSKPKIEARFLKKLESFNQEMLAKNMLPSTRVLELELIAAPANVAEKLGISAGEQLLYIKRLRFADDDPIVLLDTYVPCSRFPGLQNEDFVAKSLYTLLEEKYNTRVVRVSRQIEAVNASSYEAEMLQIERHAAVCLTKTTAYTQDESPVEYSVARYRGDRNKFVVDLLR